MPTPTTPAPLRGGTPHWIRASRLSVDAAYQRPRNERKIRKIINGFDPDAFGVLYVSKRDDGSFVILDGQQRHAAVMQMGWDSQQVPCHVYTGLSVADEARLFGEYNDLRTRPRPLDLHRAAVVANDERALRIEKVLSDMGLRLAPGGGLGNIASVQACQNIFDNGGERTLKESLTICTRAWGQESTSFNGEVMIAVGAMVARHGRTLDRDRLTRVLNKMEPKALVSRARTIKVEMAGSEGGSAMRASAFIASLIVQAYNFRLPESSRLAWDMNAGGKAFWRSADQPSRRTEPARDATEQRRHSA